MRNILVIRLLVTLSILATLGPFNGNADQKSLFAQSPAGQQESEDGSRTATDAATEVEIQRKFNKLRREILDDRADSIRLWLTGIAVLFAVLALAFAALLYVVFKRSQEYGRELQGIVEEARVHAAEAGKFAEEAGKFAEEARSYGEKDDEPMRIMADADLILAQTQVVEDFSRDPGRAGASAIADARRLEEDGNLNEAVDRWRHIANVAEGTNDELAALAFRSIGDLSEKISRSAES